MPSVQYTIAAWGAVETLPVIPRYSARALEKKKKFFWPDIPHDIPNIRMKIIGLHHAWISHDIIIVIP